MAMTWQQIESHWDAVKPKALERWPVLANAPSAVNGSKQSLFTALTRADYHPQEAEHQLDEWRRTLPDLPAEESAPKSTAAAEGNHPHEAAEHGGTLKARR